MGKCVECVAFLSGKVNVLRKIITKTGFSNKMKKEAFQVHEIEKTAQRCIDAAVGKVPLYLLSETLVTEFLEYMLSYFKKQPQLIKLPEENIVIVGDVHGDFTMAKKVVEEFSSTHSLLFLGDYVDRSPEPDGDIKVVLYLFGLIALGKQIILLRGNHEDEHLNSYYGFKKTFEKLWKLGTLCNKVFAQLPLAGYNKKIIAVHGGLPDIEKLDEINKVPKGLIVSQHPILDQLLWNDCVNQPEQIIQTGNRGVRDAIVYGEKYFTQQMQRFGKNFCFRGHDYHAKGTMYHNRCITLLTSRSYAQHPQQPHDTDEQKSMQGCLIAIVQNKSIVVKDMLGIQKDMKIDIE